MIWHFLADIPDIQNNLFPNLTTLISHIIASAIILYFVVKWAWKPFKKSQQERSEYIRKNIRDAENSKLMAAHYEEVTQKYLEEAKIEALQIVSDAKLKAQEKAESILKETNLKSEILAQEAIDNIERDKIKNAKKTREEIINISLLAAQKIVEKNIDKETNEKLISEFIDSLDK